MIQRLMFQFAMNEEQARGVVSEYIRMARPLVNELKLGSKGTAEILHRLSGSTAYFDETLARELSSGTADIQAVIPKILELVTKLERELMVTSKTS